MGCAKRKILYKHKVALQILQYYTGDVCGICGIYPGFQALSTHVYPENQGQGVRCTRGPIHLNPTVSPYFANRSPCIPYFEACLRHWYLIPVGQNMSICVWLCQNCHAFLDTPSYFNSPSIWLDNPGIKTRGTRVHSAVHFEYVYVSNYT